MDLQVTGRSYVVSGASAGLGFATAAVLAAEGAAVVLCSRDQARVAAAADRLDADGAAGRVAAVAADLGHEQTALLLVNTALERFGRLDGAVISVGGPPAGTVTEVDDAAWRASFETVFLGPLRLARRVLAVGGGMAVTFILSTSVRAPIAGLGLSNGLRPGLAGAAKSLADEHGPRGSRVNVVLPGRIDTDRIRELESGAEDPAALRAAIMATVPLRRYGRPEELGRVAAFLTSPAASFVSGAAVPVDGGMTRAL